jgi:glycosyltransferase involved in cell wall biosynthesis
MMRAQALIMPTTYVEPFGNVAIEAMACGTPVICTDWGAMTETVIHGKTGYRCRTFQEFIEASYCVKHLDPNEIRNHVAQNYSLEVIGPKYERYFERLLTLWTDGWYYLPPLLKVEVAA